MIQSQPHHHRATISHEPKCSHTKLAYGCTPVRVLEDKEGGNGKKIKTNVKGGVFVKGSGISIPDSEDGTVIDVIDELGFVDGVKVARKCSKASVLGKPVD